MEKYSVLFARISKEVCHIIKREKLFGVIHKPCIQRQGEGGLLNVHITTCVLFSEIVPKKGGKKYPKSVHMVYG